MDEEILKGLLKRAKGYSYKEVQEEFAIKEDGEMALTKRKVTKKYCPPDGTALRTYLELNGVADVSQMSDEELEKERKRLLLQLKEEHERCGEKKKKN